MILRQLRVNYLVFGKTQYFLSAEAGIARCNRSSAAKEIRMGLRYLRVYGGGLTIGFVKPYMFDVEDEFGNSFQSKYPEIIDSSYYVVKARGLSGGWSELKVRPGLYAKTGYAFRLWQR